MIDNQWLTDIANEEKFLAAIHKHGDAHRELQSMFKIYGEMVEGLTTMRFDVEIYGELAKTDPENNLSLPDKTGYVPAWEDLLKATKKALAVRRVVIKHIREQIIRKMEDERQARLKK